MSKAAYKSPLKEKPLPNPGSSLDAKIKDLIDIRATQWILAPIIAILITAYEWLRWYFPNERAPWAVSVFAIVVAAYSFKRVLGIRKEIVRVRQGRDGEVAVGQFLERLREKGAKVFHDIPGDGFNLDHVIIHTTGIYVVETKSISKPVTGEAKLLFNGEAIICTGRFSTDKPLIQVRAARGWLVGLLQESTGRRLDRSVVRSVVVYPGWYIQPTAEARSSDVWVLNPKALPEFIAGSRDQISSEDVHLYSLHLSKYIRTHEPLQ